MSPLTGAPPFSWAAAATRQHRAFGRKRQQIRGGAPSFIGAIHKEKSEPGGANALLGSGEQGLRWRQGDMEHSCVYPDVPVTH